MSYIDKDKLLSSITKEDFITILKSLGQFKYRKGTNNSITTTTFLCHGGDSPYKLYYYPNGESGGKNGLCVCMTCGEKFDLIQFIIRAYRNQGKQITWHKALTYIAVTLGRVDDVTIDSPTKIKKVDDFAWIDRIKAAKNRECVDTEIKEINENILDLFTYIPHEAWLNDGCNTFALNRYEISYSPQDNAIVIPHRDIDGKLIGIRGRYLSERDIEKGKYRPITVENKTLKHPLGNFLYGLWVTKDYIKKCGKILLAEGEKSCLQAYSMFCDSGEEQSYVVATCGSSISHAQIDIIKNLGVSKIIYAPDREYHNAQSYEAEAWFNKQILKLEPLVLYCKVYLIADVEERLGYKDSPFDKGKDTFLQLYEEKIEITLEDVNRVKEEMKKGVQNE